MPPARSWLAAAAATWNDMLCGIAVILLTLPRGVVRDRYCRWDALIV
jgi:hypothetical protein